MSFHISNNISSNSPLFLHSEKKKTNQESNLTAMAMAIENSVTVSMGEDTNGAFKMIFLVGPLTCLVSSMGLGVVFVASC